MKKRSSIYSCLILITIGITPVACSKSGGTSNTTKSITVSTLAGSGTQGSANGTGTSASFSFPASIVVGGAGLLYIEDFGNSLVRTVNISNAAVSSFAGNGIQGLLNGTAANAEFNGTANIAFDQSGNLFVADEENAVIREITSTGNVITVAGTGVAGYKDGAGSTAQFNFPEGIVYDGAGNLYVADGHNNLIRKIILSTGMVSTYAGTGAAGITNGVLSSASFNDPYGLALDAGGNIYVADIKKNCIRKITVATGMVSTFAGTGTRGFTNGTAATATFNYPLACIFDSQGNLYVSDTYNNVIRKVSISGNVTTLAGNGSPGATDGLAAAATFNFPIGIAINGANIYVADTHNNKIRKINLGQ